MITKPRSEADLGIHELMNNPNIFCGFVLLDAAENAPGEA
jgi:hypothetical protein